MCNYSEGVREAGRMDATLTNLKALMKNLHLTAEQAMDTLEIPREERAEILNLLQDAEEND